MQVFTVWASLTKKGSPKFDIYPKVKQSEISEDALYLTNNSALFEGMFPQGNSAVIPILDLYSLAFPLAPIETLNLALEVSGESPKAHSGKALYSIWERMEKPLREIPLWALECIEGILREIDSTGIAMLFSLLAQELREKDQPTSTWIQSFPSANLRENRRILPPFEDCSPLDSDLVIRHLGDKGTLSQMMNGYETRKGQIQMSQAIVSAFNEGKHLMVEAGTGVGKSLAYLIPAAAWARLNDLPVIVSTNTRNLQSQLVQKDIPQVLEAFRKITHEDVPFRAAVLKGRSNYFCLRRLHLLLDNGAYEFDRSELRHFAQAIAWAIRTPDGDLDSFCSASRCDPAFLTKLYCPGEECPGRSCRFYRRCFLQKARAKAAAAHIVIANHSLVFAEAQAAGAILPPYSQVIFDEAHNLEEVATRHLSTELSMPRITQMLRRLSRGKGTHMGGLLEVIRRQLTKGDLTDDQEQITYLSGLVQKSRKACDTVRAKFKKFFGDVRLLLPKEVTAVRYRCERALPLETMDMGDLFDQNLPQSTSVETLASARWKRLVCRDKIFVDPPEEWDELKATQSKETARESVAALAQILMELRDGLRLAQTDELGLYSDLPASLDGMINTIQELLNDMDFVWGGSDDEHVFWAEIVTHSSTEAKLTAAPLSIGKQLEDFLYQQKSSVIFCSATLRVGSSFGYISNRLGINRIDPSRIVTCIAESPFNYLVQCSVLSPAYLPDPGSSSGNRAYIDQLADLMISVFIKTKGRALGLFTSYQMMNQVGLILEAPLAKAGIRLLVQGLNGSRDQITHVFREGKPAVLLGTHSFWEGVDIAGDALSCVVMARLPFSAVGDPIVEARCEQIEKNGRSAFREYSLPIAVIRFRQGFGRLIRSKSDRGAVIIADPRLMTKNYGATFRKSLPCPVNQVKTKEALIDRISFLFDQR